MKKNILKVALVLSLAAMGSNGYAATTSDVEKLEREFISIENQLLTPEIRLDELNKERSEYDGISGWFKFSKKKALDAEIENKEAEANKLGDSLTKLNKEIQSKVFDVAKTYEENGNYDKAIEFYMKVVNPDDKVRERLAACYKAKKEYSVAIKWLLEMKRTDVVMLEVSDCYFLNNCRKEATKWLFDLLEPYEGNSAEQKALKLIEERKYASMKQDFPDFNTRLANIYISKAFKEDKAKDSAKANVSYRKAASLVAEETGKSLDEASKSIVAKYQQKHQEAVVIYNRQQEAALQNYEDKLHRLEDEVHDAKRRLEMARRDADHHYMRELDRAKDELRRAEERERAAMGNPNASESEKSSARQRVGEARRHLDRVMHDRDRIIKDYMRPYHSRVRDAVEERDKFQRNREVYLEDYVKPYKKDMDTARDLLSKIRVFDSNL